MGKVRRGNLRGEEEREDQGDETPRAAHRCSGVDGVVGQRHDGRNWRRTAAFLHDAARRRLARGVFECRVHVCAAVQGPAKILVEVPGRCRSGVTTRTGEHPGHTSDVADCPILEGLIMRGRWFSCGQLSAARLRCDGVRLITTGRLGPGAVSN